MAENENEQSNQEQTEEAAREPKAGKAKSGVKSKVIVLVVCLVVVAVVAAALFMGISSGAAASSSSASSSSTQGSSSSAATSSGGDSDTGYLGLRVKTEGYDADAAAPAIAHVTGTSDAGTAVDSYASLLSGGTTKIELPAGTYNVELLDAINADGSLYEVPEGFTAKVNAAGIAAASINLTYKPAKEVTADEMQAALDATTTAVAASNGSLDAEIATLASDNAAQNPNMN